MDGWMDGWLFGWLLALASISRPSSFAWHTASSRLGLNGRLGARRLLLVVDGVKPVRAADSSSRRPRKPRASVPARASHTGWVKHAAEGWRAALAPTRCVGLVLEERIENLQDGVSSARLPI